MQKIRMKLGLSNLIQARNQDLEWDLVVQDLHKEQIQNITHLAVQHSVRVSVFNNSTSPTPVEPQSMPIKKTLKGIKKSAGIPFSNSTEWTKNKNLTRKWKLCSLARWVLITLRECFLLEHQTMAKLQSTSTNIKKSKSKLNLIKKSKEWLSWGHQAPSKSLSGKGSEPLKNL